uniref:Uncharacterized protein n=1 Tax=Rhizophagus irregularis (strain DAOM 181602 / DAOM 197198 / MUCL 43194) TaxID=747089 RepID=U9T0P8_RHIID
MCPVMVIRYYGSRPWLFNFKFIKSLVRVNECCEKRDRIFRFGRCTIRLYEVLGQIVDELSCSMLATFLEMQNTKAIKDFWQGVEELNRRNEINKKKSYLDYLVINGLNLQS